MCFGPRSHSSLPSTEQNADWVHLAQCICCFHSRNLLKPVRPQWDVNEGRFGAGWALKLKIWKAYFRWLMRSKFPPSSSAHRHLSYYILYMFPYFLQSLWCNGTRWQIKLMKQKQLYESLEKERKEGTLWPFTEPVFSIYIYIFPYT